MDVQDVSKMPIKRNTPSRMSRMTSGGARNDRISDNASLRISDTAARASIKRGSISASSSSMACFLNKITPIRTKNHKIGKELKMGKPYGDEIRKYNFFFQKKKGRLALKKKNIEQLYCKSTNNECGHDISSITPQLR